MLLGSKNGGYANFLSFEFNNKYRTIIGGDSEKSTKYWNYLLYPNTGVQNVYALLHLA